MATVPSLPDTPPLNDPLAEDVIRESTRNHQPVLLAQSANLNLGRG